MSRLRRGALGIERVRREPQHALRLSRGGFSLAEVLVAVSLLTTLALGAAQLFAMAARAVTRAQWETTSLALAVEKMEQLRSLTWRFDGEAGHVLSDFSSDLTRDPPAEGGAGLASSLRDTLWESTPGYVDYLDGAGRWLGTGLARPAETQYVRRWSVEPFAADSQHTLILHVAVTRLNDEIRRGGSPSRVPIGRVVMLSTLRTRQ